MLLVLIQYLIFLRFPPPPHPLALKFSLLPAGKLPLWVLLLPVFFSIWGQGAFEGKEGRLFFFSAAPTWLVFPKITLVSFFSIYILLFGEVNLSHNFSLHLYSGDPQNSLHNPDFTLPCHTFVSNCLLDKSFSSSLSIWS